MAGVDIIIAAADGLDLAVRIDGAGDPIVFLHGSGGGLESWADISAELAPDYQSWSMARRGWDPSGIPLQRNAFADEAADALAVVAHAAAETGRRVHLVGGSYGALVALHAAAVSTDHIASLAVYEPPVLQTGSHLEPVIGRYRAMTAAGELIEAMAMFVREAARMPEDVLRAGAPSEPPDPVQTRRAAAGVLRDLEAMAADSPDVTRWSSIAVPVLLMQGADTWEPIPTGMDQLAAVLPDPHRVIWAGQSHFATATAPSLVVATLREFLGTVRGRL
jgi:pimeloyl-ACP methyl ester carboxylesterase